MICGGIWTVFFVMGFFITITDESEDDIAFGIFVLICIALGVWIFLKGHRRKKMRLIFKKYIAQLSVDPTGSLENIAAASGTSVDVVKKNIQFMLKKKFFSNAFLDETNNQLVLSSMANKANVSSAPANDFAIQGQPQKEIVYKSCNCLNCGGINKIVQGTVVECDFCGSPLQG